MEKLPKDKDRRRALTDEQRAEIKKLYRGEGLAIREIARRFDGICTRRLIQFVLFPERERRVAEHYKERGQSKTTYERIRGKKWRDIMREHRAYKKKVFENL